MCLETLEKHLDLSQRVKRDQAGTMFKDHVAYQPTELSFICISLQANQAV